MGYILIISIYFITPATNCLRAVVIFSDYILSAGRDLKCISQLMLHNKLPPKPSTFKKWIGLPLSLSGKESACQGWRRGFHLPSRKVPSPIQEGPTSCRANKPVSQSSWACVLQLLKPARPRARVPRRETAAVRRQRATAGMRLCLAKLGRSLCSKGDLKM